MTTQMVTNQERAGKQQVPFLPSRVTTQTLYRLGGVAVLVGGVLGALSEALHPADPAGPATLVDYARAAQSVHLLMFVGVIVLLLGLPAVYARQSQQTGILGLAGFVLLFWGLLLLALPHSVIDFALLPTLVAQVPDQVMPIFMAQGADPIAAFMAMIAEPTLVIGVFVWAFATLRARVFPRWPACLLLVAIVMNILWNFLSLFPALGWEPGPVLFYLALASFGLPLLTDKTH